MNIKSYPLILIVLILLAGCWPGPDPKIDVENETASILAVIAKETESYYEEDFEAWKSTYVTEPYFRLFGYWEGFDHKVKYHNGFNSLETEKRSQFEQGATIWVGSRVERLDENIRIYPEVAWVTFEEHTYNLETGALRGKSLQTRILEKQNGAWKIAYLGYHFFPATTTQNRQEN